MHLVSDSNTTEAIPNYPSLTRTTNLDGINDQSFTIDQFRDIRIDQVDDGTGIEYQIATFNTSINVPYDNKCTTRRDTDIWHCKGNAFDNNFIRFDSSTETFDETSIHYIDE